MMAAPSLKPSASLRRMQRAIAASGSIDDLRAMIKAARAREADLLKDASEKRACEQEITWAAARKTKSGHFAAAFRENEFQVAAVPPGGRQSKPVQKRFAAGTVLTVHSVQPRAKRIWLTAQAGGEIYAMTPRELALLDIRFFPDELTLHVALATGRLTIA